MEGSRGDESIGIISDMLASCKLTYCLRPLSPDCPELFGTIVLSVNNRGVTRMYLVYQDKDQSVFLFALLVMCVLNIDIRWGIRYIFTL